MNNSFKYAFASIACFAVAVGIGGGVAPFNPLAELFAVIILVLIGGLLGVAAIDSSKK